MPNGKVANVWDNHGGTGGLGGITGYAMLKEKYCLPPLDRALAALLDDLSDRGLLDRTLVAVAGEFGRTPKINAAQGRDHWGAATVAPLRGRRHPRRAGVRQDGQDRGLPDGEPGIARRLPCDDLPRDGRRPGRDDHRPTRTSPHRLCDGQPVMGLF